MGWDIVEALLWYLLGVETVGRSLEELEDVFNSPFPPRAKPKHVVAVENDGRVEIIHHA